MPAITNGATIFCQRLGDDLGLELRFGIHFLQAAVLVLELGSCPVTKPF
jgi:hypothetical protein